VAEEGVEVEEGAEGSASVIAQGEVQEEAVAVAAVETNPQPPRPPKSRTLQRHNHLLHQQSAMLY
jgi:hypothetical protein